MKELFCYYPLLYIFTVLCLLKSALLFFASFLRLSRAISSLPFFSVRNLRQQRDWRKSRENEVPSDSDSAFVFF